MDLDFDAEFGQETTHAMNCVIRHDIQAEMRPVIQHVIEHEPRRVFAHDLNDDLAEEMGYALEYVFKEEPRTPYAIGHSPPAAIIRRGQAVGGFGPASRDGAEGDAPPLP